MSLRSLITGFGTKLKDELNKPRFNIQPSKPIRNIANLGQGVGNYYQNQVVNPIREGVPQAVREIPTLFSNLNDSKKFNESFGRGTEGLMKASQGVFNLLPSGVAFNAGYSGTSGAVKSLREKTNPVSGAFKGFTEGTTPSQALDIKGGWGTALDMAIPVVGPAVAKKAYTGTKIAVKVAKINPESTVKFKNGKPIPVKDIVKYLRGELTNGNTKHPDVVKLQDFVKKNPEYYYASLKADQAGFAKPSAFVGDGKVDLSKVESKLKVKSQKQIQGQHHPQSDLQSVGKQILQPKAKTQIQEIPLRQPTYTDIINPNVKERGFVSSVQEAPKVSGKSKTKVAGTYTVKPNKQLMGEAAALLKEGATIDFKNTANLDQKVTATIQQAINLDKAGKHTEAAALFNNLSEQGTELGRGVHAFSLLNQMSPEAIALSAAGKIKKYNQTATRKIPELTGEQQKMISSSVEKIRNMTDGREKNIAIYELNNRINNFIPSSFADKAITVWKAGLLTSLRTHERNLIGNSIMLGSEVAKDPIASGFDRLMSLKTGKRSMSTTINGLQEFGSKKTGQQVADMVTRGYDPSQPISKFEIKHVNWGEGKVGKALKLYTDSVFRVLGSEDKPFYNAAFSRSLYDQALTEARNAGKSGNKNFIEKLVSNPTEQMLATATKDANYATFKDKNILSNVAGEVKRTMGGNQLTKAISEIVMPFTGVPSSVAGKTIAYSPVGLIKGAINVGRVMTGSVPELQRQAAQEIGRGVMGSALFGLGAYLMSKGVMTGQPKDTAEAQQWQLENKPYNSILVGGKWRSINSVGPQTLVMLAGAKYQEEMSKPDGSPGTYAAGLGKDQLSQTFLSGVQQPLNALTDPVRYGKSYLGNQSASIVPNIVKDVAKSQDPLARETNTVPDYFKSAVPGVRNTLLPKRDTLGNPIPQEPTGVGAFVDVFNSKTPNTDPVVKELGRLYKADEKSAPSKLTKNQTILGQKVTLTPEQLDQLEQQTGQPIKEQFGRLMATQEYKSASDEVKSKALQKIVSSIREQAKLNMGAGSTSPVNIDQLSKETQLVLAKDAFDKSGKSYQLVGDTVLRRSPEGNITATSKIKYDYQLNTAKMVGYKSQGDLKGWVATARSQLQNIQTQLQDPSIDPLEATSLVNSANTLIENIKKYVTYGGFTKPKAISAKYNLATIAKNTLKPIEVRGTSSPRLDTQSILDEYAKTKAKAPVIKAPNLKKGKK